MRDARTVDSRLEGRAGSALLPWAVAVAGVVVVGLVGGLATEIGPWYLALKKPSWQPPDWLFGPVWTVIFALTAWAAVDAWQAAPDVVRRRRVVTLFVANGILNVIWSALFFKLRQPDWALAEVVLLWLSIVAMIVGTRHAPKAPWLLAPYLAWVTFAAALNFAVVRLNAPF